MANFNKVIIAGNLTRDPELRYIPSGQAVTTLGVAINRTYVTGEGEKKEEACFVNVVVWGKQAENCSEYLNKGRPVLVEGRLRSRSWEQDGVKRSTIEVVAQNVQFLGSPRGEGGSRERNPTGAGSQDSEETRIEPAEGEDKSADDIPF